MKKYLSILTALFICESASAQLDSAAMNKYLLSKPSKSELIQKWRSHTTEAIIKGDRDKVEELVYYAKMDLEDEHYRAMYPQELWNIAIWLHKYDMAISEMANFGILPESNNQHALYQYHPTLNYLTADSIFTYKQQYINGIGQNDSIAPADRDALILYIEWLVSPKKGIKTINKKCRDYYAQYYGAQLEPFILSVIHHEYKDTSPTLGYGFDIGATMYSGDLSDVLPARANINMDFIVGYKNIMFDVYIHHQGGKAKQDIIWNSGVLKEGERTSNTMFDFCLGYRVQLPYNLSITPSVGCGIFELAPGEKAEKNNPNLDKCLYWSKVDPVLSIELDFGEEFASTKPGDNDRLEKGRIATTLRYTYRSVNMDCQNFKCSGNAHTISLGLRIFYSWAKRVYQK